MLQKKCVLVVSAHEDSRFLLEVILQTEGANVVSASSAAEAVSLVNSSSPNLIFSDIAMPGTDGFSFIRAIRQSHWSRIRRIPAVAVTAIVRPTMVEETIEAGFQHCLFKPIDFDDVVRIASKLTAPKLISSKVCDFVLQPRLCSI